MKIALNCIYFTPRAGGIKEYIYNLVYQLEKINHGHELIYYITADVEGEFSNILIDKGRIRIFPFDENQKYLRSVLQQRFWFVQEKKEKFQIFHSPFFHSPRFNNAAIVLTVHDLRLMVYPQTYILPRLLYLRANVKSSISRAHSIIAISEFTRNEIVKHFGIPDTRINVIHEAVNPDAFKCKRKDKKITINNIELISETFLLAVGHLEPRKNYINLIKAYSTLSADLKEKYKLVIVGKKNHNYRKILEHINNVKETIYLEYVSRDDLIWLYANCKIHVFPSFYEGFGFPCLESGLYGKPTLGANQSSIPEIAGDGGEYFNPFNINEIRDLLSNVLSNPTLFEKLSKAAHLNTKRFSWKNNAWKTIELYNQLEK